MSSIDEKLAKAFLDDPDKVDISKATEITDEVAEILAGYEGELDLSGLTSLSDAAAESLSKHEGNLFLGGFLGGLTELTDAAAESLSKHNGYLDLSGLTTLSNAAAESLSKHDLLLGKWRLKGGIVFREILDRQPDIPMDQPFIVGIGNGALEETHLVIERPHLGLLLPCRMQ